MAEGGNYLGQAGHSRNNSHRDTGSGPEQLCGYVAQPESAVMSSLTTDMAPSLGDTFISYPPPVEKLDEGSVIRGANELDIHCQSVSGFSSYGMNEPPNGHLKIHPTNMPEMSDGRDGVDVQQMAELSLAKIPVQTQTRSSIQLEDLIAFERDSKVVDRYARTIQQLRELNIPVDDMRTVAVKNGIKCFDSRSAFFKLYDEDDASSDSSDESEARTINDYVTVPTATSTNQSSSISPNLTGANSADPQYPMYEDRNVRLRTYHNWPGKHQSGEELSGAGLFFTGKRDICRCFFCGLNIMQWKIGDNPVTEHYRGRPNCHFVCSLFRQQHLHQQDIQEQETRERNKSSNRICQACNINKIGVTQYRCGHIVCSGCAPAKRASGERRYCKICGQEVESTTAYDSTAL